MEIAPPVLLRIRNAFRVPQFRYPALAVVLGIVVSLAYLPGLAGPFVLDDIPNLVQNSALVPPTLTFETIKQAALSGISGALERLLRRGPAKRAAVQGHEPDHSSRKRVTRVRALPPPATSTAC